MVRAARIDEVGNPDLLLRCHLDRAQSDGGIVRPLERYFGMRKSNTFILLIIVGGYISLAYNLTYWGLAILFIFYIVRGFATPILKGYINQMTFSEMRATVLSIRNFVIRLIFAAIAPFIGWLNDFYSLRVALLVSAGIIAIPGILFLVLQFRKAD